MSKEIAKESPLSVEEFLRPRYKVIATYPFNDHFMLNEVITLGQFDYRGHLSIKEYYTIKQPLSSAGNAIPITMYESTFDQYPHLFKKIEWWEERTPEQMPEYVKYWDTSFYFPVEIVCNGEEAPFIDNNYTASNFRPATESDYLSYIKTQNK